MHWYVDALEVFKSFWTYAVAAGVGTIIGHVAFYLLLGSVTRKKLKSVDDDMAKRDTRIKELKAELYDLSFAHTKAMRELEERRIMMAEERNHNRAWAMRARDLSQRYASVDMKTDHA